MVTVAMAQCDGGHGLEQEGGISSGPSPASSQSKIQTFVSLSYTINIKAIKFLNNSSPYYIT